MIEYQSMGLVDVGYARMLTERFTILIDGEDVGLKDLWYEGRMFCINDSGNLGFRPPNKTYVLDCPEELHSKVYAKFPGNLYASEGDYVVFDNDNVDDCNIEDIYHYIQLLIKRQKQHEERMAAKMAESAVCC